MRQNNLNLGQILGMRGQIRQLLVNVIGNALDAMPDGGVLAIAIARSKMNNGHSVRVLVCDSGPGIDRKTRARVFEPFFTTKGDSRSGIGLWISKQIVEKHGGAIRLRCSQQRARSGTCVSIYLPVEIEPTGQKSRNMSGWISEKIAADINAAYDGERLNERAFGCFMVGGSRQMQKRVWSSALRIAALYDSTEARAFSLGWQQVGHRPGRPVLVADRTSGSSF